MDATDEHKGEPGSHSSSFFDKKVFVNIMNFARVEDCMLSMSTSGNLLQSKIENQLDYSILLDSETVGIENRLQGFEVAGIRHRVTLRGHGSEHEESKGESDATLGYDPYDAIAYDLPVPSTENGQQRCVRMWKPEAVKNDPLVQFQATDNLELQYFVISASLQDLLARYLEAETTFAKFKKNVVIEFDDHLMASIAQLEFIRLLCEQHDFTMDEAIELTKSCFKVNPAATPNNDESDVILDKFMSKLPMHFQIIEQLEKLRVGQDAPQDFHNGHETKLVVDYDEKSLSAHGHKNVERRDIKIEEVSKMLSTSEV